MVNFPETVSRLDRLRLKKLDQSFREYAWEGLRGEELDPSSMQLGRSVQLTIATVQDIDDIEVPEVSSDGDGVLRVQCEVALMLELDLNDEEDNTAMSEAKMIITLEFDLGRRKIGGISSTRPMPPTPGKSGRPATRTKRCPGGSLTDLRRRPHGRQRGRLDRRTDHR